MILNGVHILLTLRCLFECDHCFVWGSPRQRGALTLARLEDILDQAADLGTVEWIYFEGGEPFLYYPVLLRAVQEAARRGFRVGVVSNGYWATEVSDAEEWLRPLVGIVQDLAISSDDYHGDAEERRCAENACEAARRLSISAEVLAVGQPEEGDATRAVGTLPAGTSAVMFRGRAADELAGRVTWHPQRGFTECPCEDLRSPGRVHVDPLGNVHLCQGITIGNAFRQPLSVLCADFRAETHPIAGPLLEGGPAELVRRYGLDSQTPAADACHLCYRARVALRERFPDLLQPDQMYGIDDR